jgi:hypothetical protein
MLLLLFLGRRAKRVSGVMLRQQDGRPKRVPHERTSAAGERVNLVGMIAVPIVHSISTVTAGTRTSGRSERAGPGGRSDHFRHS